MDSNDLCTLKNLDEESLVEVLKKRYLASRIYTNSGLFLISINPYKHIDIYSEETARQYKRDDEGGSMHPHVYSVLEQCLRDRDVYGDHTIIINGDSGAGKTACARYMLEYLGIPAMKDADVILEGLGNCKTVLNDNSSRFGKLIRLNGTVKIETYLLERSRVTTAPQGEGNFHVFYYILASRNETLVNDYINTEQGTESAHEGLVRSYDMLVESFLRLSIDFCEVERVLLGIIYLGSIKIQNGAVLRTDEYHKVVEYLSLDEKAFNDFLVTKRMRAGMNEEVVKILSESESYTMRNSLARLLYDNMFHYVLGMVNEALRRHPIEVSQLNILDIFGFENFENNGLEQFCINWCNERIHNHFVRDTFEHQKSMLIAEAVDLKQMGGTCPDVKNIGDIKINGCSALENVERKVGVADLIAEESLINGNAVNLSLKLEKYIGAKIKPGNRLVFEHFNGSLEYLLDDFVEKNREKCSFGTLFCTSEGFFRFIVESPVVSGNVVGAFRASLDHLFDIIGKTRVKYIKCIKPNAKKIPLAFDDELVAKQLRSSGVVESIELSRHMFSYALDFSAFRARYPFTTVDDPCLTKGKSRVFMNNAAFLSLENRKQVYIDSIDAVIREFSDVFLIKRIISDLIQSRRPMETNSTESLRPGISGTEMNTAAELDDSSSHLKKTRAKESQYMRIIETLEAQAEDEYRIACTSEEAPDLKALESENRALRKVIYDLKNELEIIKHMKVSAKSINSQIFQSKYTLKSNSSDLELLQERFNDLSFIGNYAGDISLFGVFKSMIDLFVEHIPVYSEIAYSRDEILCFSQCIYYMISSSFQQNVKGAFDIFIDELNKQAPQFQEGFPGILFVLSNLVELRCLFKCRLETLSTIMRKFPLSSQQAVSGCDTEATFSSLNSEVAFLHYVLGELDLSIKNMLTQLGTLVIEDLSGILPDAILDYEPMKDLNSRTKTIRKWLFSSPTISKAIQYMENLYGLGNYYGLPQQFTFSIITFCLSAVDQITFNSFVSKKRTLSFEKCYEIRYNLVEIEKFCFNIGFRDAFQSLMYMNEAVRIASAISRLALYTPAERKSVERGGSAEYATESEEVRQIIGSTFLNCNQVNAIAAKFVVPLFDVVGYDTGAEKQISKPKIMCPDIEELSSDSKFVEPSYLPQRSLTKILQYFYDS